MYSQEYEQFSSCLNELQVQVISGNVKLATEQAKHATAIFHSVQTKMTQLANNVCLSLITLLHNITPLPSISHPLSIHWPSYTSEINIIHIVFTPFLNWLSFQSGNAALQDDVTQSCAKFQSFLFEIVKATKQALGTNDSASRSLLASLVVQTCAHMLTLEVTRRNCESGMILGSGGVGNDTN